ncbi:MAG: DUF1848 family protein, partial [Candidatus Aminicenantaceae bacterium]
SQDFATVVPGIKPSACIDGHLLQELHPEEAPVSVRKDKTQRTDCRCTESVDIGSYAQSCPQSCLYCYANPSLDAGRRKSEVSLEEECCQEGRGTPSKRRR